MHRIRDDGETEAKDNKRRRKRDEDGTTRGTRGVCKVGQRTESRKHDRQVKTNLTKKESGRNLLMW